METRSPRRRSPWRPTRRVTDYVFRYVIPGKHHSLDGTLVALLTARDHRADLERP